MGIRRMRGEGDWRTSVSNQKRSSPAKWTKTFVYVAIVNAAIASRFQAAGGENQSAVSGLIGQKYMRLSTQILTRQPRRPLDFVVLQHAEREGADDVVGGESGAVGEGDVDGVCMGRVFA